MSIYNPTDNKIVVCPYDSAHKLRASRYQIHIANCTSRHDISFNKKMCPFNKTHVVRPGEMDHHLKNCPDRAPLDRQLCQNVNNNNPYKGRTEVPVYPPDPVDADESWEIDDDVTVELPPPPPGAILAPPDMAKPSERRQFYIKLHRLPERGSELSSSKLSSATSSTSNPQSKSSASNPSKSSASSQSKSSASGAQFVPRQPNKPNEVQSLQKSNPQTLENLSVEKGKQTSAAANYPCAASSYSKMVKDMSQMALGRGNPAGQGAVNNFSEEDFPALGCGGNNNSSNVPKQNSKPPAFKKKSKKKSKNP